MRDKDSVTDIELEITLSSDPTVDHSICFVKGCEEIGKHRVRAILNHYWDDDVELHAVNTSHDSCLEHLNILVQAPVVVYEDFYKNIKPKTNLRSV